MIGMRERTVGAYEAKTHLAALLEEAEAGTTITITRRGKPVARLVPVEEDERARRRQAIEDIKAMQEERRRSGAPKVTIEEIIAWKHEGHER
jgi:prevent-host-death family protein